MEDTVTDGMSVSLSWDHSARIKSGDPAVPRPRQVLRVHRSRGPRRHSLCRRLVHLHTIPDPFNTQKHLGVTTCLPSTISSKDHQRIAVINGSLLETLVIMDDNVVGDGKWLLFLFINTVPTDVPLTAL